MNKPVNSSLLSMKKLLVIIPALLAVLTASCKQENEKEDFCSFVDTGNFDKTIPFIDKYLSGLSGDQGQQLQALTAWLKSQPCLNDASVLCQSCIDTDPPTSEITVSFNENGITKSFILDISMAVPLKVTGYHELKEEFGSYVNSKDFDLARPFINDFLTSLSHDWEDEQRLQALAVWLNSYRSVLDAAIACQSCLPDYYRGLNKIAVQFDENGTTKKIILKFTNSYLHNYEGFKPMQYAGYYECYGEDDGSDGEVPYQPCSCENPEEERIYGEAYLYRDSIPYQRFLNNTHERSILGVLNMIVFNSETNSAVLYHYIGSFLCYCAICNFPDFANEWDIPKNGLTVYFDGRAHQMCKPIAGPGDRVYLDLILTTFKRKCI
jgi:hypothetical protein